MSYYSLDYYVSYKGLTPIYVYVVICEIFQVFKLENELIFTGKTTRY